VVDLISFDTTSLMNYYTARINLRAASSIGSANISTQFDDTKDIETPWATGREDKGIAGRLAELRGRTSFFDFGADNVKVAGDDADTKNLFGMYEALRRLRTVAEYAADDKTPAGILGSLNAQFQGGLAEIGDFLKTAAFSDATILFGEKSDDITSRAAAGRIDRDYVGRTAVIGEKDAPLTNLTGNETFTISIDKGTATDTFTMDLSQISGDITLQKIVDLANNQIAAVTDVNDDGETVERYRSRLTIEDLSDTSHALKVRGFAGETVTFDATGAEPTLTIAGTVQHTGSTWLTEGFLYSLGDLDSSDPTTRSRTQIASTAPGAQLIAEQQAEDHEDDDTYVASEIDKANTGARAVTTDPFGNTYVVGNAEGDMGGQFSQGSNDVYVSKYDSAGTFLWARLLGSSSDTKGYSIAADADGNVVIAGQTDENLSPGAVIDSQDSFVTKYASDGEEVFTRQVQSAAADGALDLAIDGNGDIYVSGHVKGVIDANATAQGGTDAYIQKISGADGTVAYTSQYGTAGNDKATSIAIAGDGNILALSQENGNAVLRKLDAGDPTNELFSVNLGPLGTGAVTDLAVDGSAIYISGYTDDAAFGGGGTATAHHGGTDGFVVRVDDAGGSGSTAYTSFIGSAGADRAFSLAVNNGDVYVVGSTDSGINGETLINGRDGFAVKMDGGTGAQTWTRQFGGGQGLSEASSVTVNTMSDSVLGKLGLPNGTIAQDESRTVVSQSSVRAGDYFYISINGGAKRKVTIDADDTFKTLATKVNRLSFLYMTARASFTTANGDALTIQAERGAKIDIIAGDGAHDALKGLGMEPTKIVDDLSATDSDEDSTDDTKATDDKKEDDPSHIWGLELSGGIHVSDQKAAQYALSRIDSALTAIRDIYRALNPDPLIEALKKQKAAGPAPAYLQARLANYQAGLARLTSGASQAGLLL
jgi:hypothetical protein